MSDIVEDFYAEIIVEYIVLDGVNENDSSVNEFGRVDYLVYFPELQIKLGIVEPVEVLEDDYIIVCSLKKQKNIVELLIEERDRCALRLEFRFPDPAVDAQLFYAELFYNIIYSDN